MPDDRRPSPEDLLARAAAEREKARRGRLKLFFGASPGVGETYAMLEAAHARRRAGVDVVVGCGETHGRADTEALARGLERVAVRVVDHRGVTLREMDLDGILARRPALVLVDVADPKELAYVAERNLGPLVAPTVVGLSAAGKRIATLRAPWVAKDLAEAAMKEGCGCGDGNCGHGHE